MLEQADLLRNLEVRRPRQLLVHFLLDLRVDARHSEQLRAIRPDDVVPHRPLLELIEVRHDQHRGEFALVAEHDGLGDVLVGLDFVLEWLGRDVFSARGYDDVLLPIGDGEKSIAQHSDVAGVKPAVGIDRLTRCIGFVVVPLHDVRAAGEDLAIGRDLDLYAVDRFPWARPVQELWRAIRDEYEANVRRGTDRASTWRWRNRPPRSTARA